MRKLLFIIGATLILSSCEHTVNNNTCKCDGTCCQPQDSTCVVQGQDVTEEPTEEVVTEEGGQ